MWWGMLAPFHCPIKGVFPHIGQDELDRCHMEKAELEELFATWRHHFHPQQA